MKPMTAEQLLLKLEADMSTWTKKDKAEVADSLRKEYGLSSVPKKVN
jgi:hypothetical protein